MGLTPRVLRSSVTLRRTFTAPGPTWYRYGRPPCQACGTVLFGFARLYPAKRSAITCNCDFALYRNAHRVELGIVFDESVIHVDHISRHISRRAVSVHGEVLRECGCGIAGNLRLRKL